MRFKGWQGEEMQQGAVGSPVRGKVVSQARVNAGSMWLEALRRCDWQQQSVLLGLGRLTGLFGRLRPYEVCR